MSAPAAALRLEHREPLDAAGLLSFLGQRAVPGVEAFTGGRYARSLRVAGGEPAVVEVAAEAGAVAVTVHGTAVEESAATVRRLFDLDADPAAIGAVLGADPDLGPLVAACPGLRLPGAADGFELLVRAVLGQQVSVAAARTLAGRVVDRWGTPLARPAAGVERLFPTAADLAEADLSGVGLPSARARTVRSLAALVAEGALVLDGSVDPDAVDEVLAAVAGVGPWTVSYVRMRALGDADAFPASDLGVRRALERLGLPGDPRSARRRAEAWRPWRGYATLHLWRSLSAPTGDRPR